MSKKKIMAALLVVIALVSSLVILFLFRQENSEISLRIDYYNPQWDGTVFDLDVGVTNPSNHTLYNCVIRVNYIGTAGSILTTTSKLGVMSPGERSGMTLELQNVCPQIGNFGIAGINCTAHGFTRS